MAGDRIRFLLNDLLVEVDDAAPTMSVLAFLRQRAQLTGTKEGCAEGDCGACTVVVGQLSDEADAGEESSVTLKAVNACIQFLPTLDGKALFTIEALRDRDGGLHPVQEALVQCHGSQCGFCTPGFAMSLWALYVNGDGNPSECEVRQSITGNLCRCTGYRPIIEAGLQMGARLPRRVPARDALGAALRKLRRSESLEYDFHGQRFFAPRSLAELVALRRKFPVATLLAGGTDVGLWVNKQLRELDPIIYTGEVAELRRVDEDEAALVFGAAVPLGAVQAHLKDVYPEMNEMWERFASLPIRNAGTLGGNVANGSPIGDSMPALIALGAEIVLADADGRRTMPLEELYLAYQKKSMRDDEVVVSIRVPKPSPERLFRIYKLSKRFDSDISAVCGAFSITLDAGQVDRCRIAYGGMAATPKRALEAERALIGGQWTETAVHAAMDALARDFQPLSDMRASADYRREAAANLLYRFFLETRATEPLPATALSVFA